MPNNRSVCAKCMYPIIDSECGCLDELTASPVERGVMRESMTDANARAWQPIAKKHQIEKLKDWANMLEKRLGELDPEYRFYPFGRENA
jgi:hypothetical protein